MKFSNKLIIIIVTVLCSLSSASAQMRTAYFMEGSYFRTDMNAALAPTRGYIKLPMVGGLGIDFGNNYFSVNNFLFKHMVKLKLLRCLREYHLWLILTHFIS